MAKFCTKCGKQLEEGEVCCCNNQQTQVQAEQKYKQVGQNHIGVYFSRLWNVTLQIAKTPADMLKKYVGASDVEVAFGYIGVQAIAIALFFIALFSKLNSLFDGFGLFGGLLGLDSIKFPLVKIFFLTITFSVGLSFAFAGILLFFTKVVFRAETDFKKMICVAGAKSIAAIPFTLVALILTFVNVSVGIFFLSLGTILGYFYVVYALKGAADIDDNKSIYILFLSFAILVIVFGIIIKIAIPMYMPSSSGLMKGGLNYFK